MATATLTFTADANGFQRVGRQTKVSGQLVASNDDYAAGGIAVAASHFSLSRLDTLDIHGPAIDGTGAILAEPAVYDKAAGKISMFTSAGDGDPMDESNTTSIGGYIWRCTAYGAA